jgi:hypothetical protein
MINKRKNTFLIICLFISFWSIGIISFGQSNIGFSISGTVADSTTKKTIEYASVAIYKISNTTPLTGMITNDKGAFVIHNLTNGEYLLKVNFMGYKTKTKNFAISNASVQLGEPVLIISSAVSLAEVLVVGKMNEKQVSIEKTKINVSQNISAISGNVTEVLKSQSSINIDADNNIYLRGNGNILILIDGKPTTVSSLNSIPASNIENIEIVTNPDAKYDAEGTGGIINIITKKSITGLNSAITLNYGVNNRINGGISVNYSRGIWDLGLSYNQRYEIANITSNLIRQFYDVPTLIEQNIQSIQVNTNHTASMLISARPNNKNIVTFGINLLTPDLSNNQDIQGNQTAGSSPGILYARRNVVGWSRKIFESSLSYKKIFEKNKNEISFDAFYSRTKGSRPSDYYINNVYLQKSKAEGAPLNMTFQVDYFKQLSKIGRIETGAKIFSRTNSFTTRFYDKDILSEDWITNPILSSDLIHSEYIYSTYLMYSDSLFKKIFYKIGSRVEYNTSNVKQIQTNEEVKYKSLYPFPFLQIKYNINATQNIGLSITRRVTRPTYPQLMSYIVVIDQMTYETGNKNLTPEIADKIELNHSLIKEKLQIRSNLYYIVTHNFITQISTLPSPQSLIVTYSNGDRSNKVGIDMDVTYKIRKSFSVNPGVSVFHVNSTGKYNEIDLRTNNTAWTGNIKTLYKPDAKTEISLLLNYNSPIALPQFRLNSIYYADLGVRRNFFSNKMTMSLTLTDIFNTRKWIIMSDNSVFKLHNDSKTDSRIIWLGVTYNFNSFKSVKSQKNESSESEGLIKLGQ